MNEQNLIQENENKKESMVFYKSFLDAINLFEDNKTKLDFCLAILNYGFHKTLPTTTNPNILAVFGVAKHSIDMCDKRYLTSIENGKKGGAPIGNQNARKCDNSITLPNVEATSCLIENSNCLKKQPKKQPKNNLTDTETKTETNTNTYTGTETETETETETKPGCFSSPSNSSPSQHNNNNSLNSSNNSHSQTNEINLNNSSISNNSLNDNNIHNTQTSLQENFVYDNTNTSHNNVNKTNANELSHQLNSNSKAEKTQEITNANNLTSQEKINDIGNTANLQNCVEEDYFPTGIEKEKFLNIKQSFINYFPNKNNKLKKFDELNKVNYNSLIINQLIAKIDLSDFLRTNNNLGLEWCLLNNEKILRGYYDNFNNNAPKNGNNTQQNMFINSLTNSYNAQIYPEQNNSKNGVKCGGNGLQYGKNLTQKQINDMNTLERYRKANNLYTDEDYNNLFVTDYQALLKELDEEDRRNRR